MLKNLLQETLAALQGDPSPVVWVGSADGLYALSWAEWAVLADVEYGNLEAEVPRDLVVVLSDGSWLARWEHHGQEGWGRYKTPTRQPTARPFVRALGPVDPYAEVTYVRELASDEDTEAPWPLGLSPAEVLASLVESAHVKAFLYTPPGRAWPGRRSAFELAEDVCGDLSVFESAIEPLLNGAVFYAVLPDGGEVRLALGQEDQARAGFHDYIGYALDIRASMEC